MKTVTEQHGYKIQFNGGKTYFLTTVHGDCIATAPTKLRIKNALKKTLKCVNKEFKDF